DGAARHSFEICPQSVKRLSLSPCGEGRGEGVFGTTHYPDFEMANSHKTVLEFRSEREAMEAGNLLSEMPALEAFPLAVVEEGGRWLLECYDDGALSGAAGSFLEYTGVAPVSREAVEVPDTDWVAETQKALPPVRAGRFLVHGSHARGLASFRWAIEIDAGR